MIDESTQLIVGLSESLPEVLGRLRKSAGQAVSIEIPAASSLFLTASEFRALHAAADREQISVTVATDDPLRQQLATLFKLTVAAPRAESEKPAANGKPLAPIGSTLTIDEQPAAGDGSTTGGGNEAQESPSPVMRRGRLGSRPMGRAVVSTPENATIEARSTEPSADEITPPPGVISHVLDRAKATTRRQQLAVIGTLVAVASVAYLGAYLFLTSATLVLSLKRQPISEDLTIAVSPRMDQPGTVASGSADLILEATPVSFALTTTQSMPATGIKTVGDAAARGRVTLSNTTVEPVTIEAGTELEDRLTGTRYAIEQRVEVPAAEGGVSGFAEAEVRSLEPGTAGNLDQGFLSGNLADGVYFNNRNSAVSGGTDKQIPVVTQADLDALEEQARVDLIKQAAEQDVEGDLVVLAPSIELSETSFVPDRQVDQEAATITMQASAQVTAQAYAPETLNAQIAAAVTAPAGYEIDPTTIRLSEPTIAEGVGEVVILAVHVDGTVRAMVTTQDRETIAEAVAGGNESEARDYLRTLPAVEQFEIRYSPGWLLNRIPSSSERVEIELR